MNQKLGVERGSQMAAQVESKLALGGKFRVFSDGRINRISNGIETPANIQYYGRNKRYAAVNYQCNGKQTVAYVHRLVATAFVPNPDKLSQVNHIDGNARNNRADNLVWATHSETTRRAYELGLINPMANAVPCTYCGAFTRAKSGICPKCKPPLKAEANEIDRRAEQADRYSRIDLSLLTDAEKKYVKHAADGMSATEIAQIYSVSKQCVSEALLWAEKKSLAGRKIPRSIANKKITLVRRLERKRRKFESVAAALNEAKAEYEAAKTALEEFEGYIQTAFAGGSAREVPNATDKT